MPKPFRTILPPSEFDFNIHHQNKVISIGSCFAENIGKKMTDLKFDISSNPFGILYNPISINTAISHLLDEKIYRPSDLFRHDGLWHSYDHHGKFSKDTQEATLRSINEEIKNTATKLRKADLLILTFGSAFVFEEKKTGRIVANCHKVPQKHFSRRRLSPKEIIPPLADTFHRLHAENTSIRILLSVSPVRHFRDGLVENNRSKAALHLAVDALVEQFEFVDYFPAYELVMDDLRDYRFFKEDMVHPNDTAVDYVWEYFANALFDNKTMDLNIRLEKIAAALMHRPFNQESEEYQLFLQKLSKKIESLEREYGFLDFTREKEFIERMSV